MRMNRRHLVALLLVCALGAATAGGANAATVTIAPGGAGVVARSTSRTQLIIGGTTVACDQIVIFSFGGPAMGMLTPAPTPGSNPRIGTITGGNSSNCNMAATITNLGLGTAGLFVIQAYAKAGTVSSLYVDRFLFLIAVAGIRCLYQVRYGMTYDEATNVLTIINTTVQRVTSLGGVCPAVLGATGTFAFAVPQTMALV